MYKMKKFALLFLFGSSVMYNQAQVVTPKASPLCKVEQKVGLTDLTLSYSRPAVNGREIFGGLIPFDAYWRLGANENTKITTSDALVFGKDTLKPGTYALFAKPSKTSWDLAIYSDYSNWGVPDNWDPKKVVMTLTAQVKMMSEKTENLNVGIDQITNSGAVLVISWDRTKVEFPFTLNSKEKVLASIQKTMAGPSANDYYQAASYYFNEKIDLKMAADWINKAVELRPEAYWMTRVKSLIQAENGDIKGAIETAQMCMKAAEKDGDMNYVNMCVKSLEEWKKRK